MTKYTCDLNTAEANTNPDLNWLTLMCDPQIFVDELCYTQ